MLKEDFSSKATINEMMCMTLTAKRKSHVQQRAIYSTVIRGKCSSELLCTGQRFFAGLMP